MKGKLSHLISRLVERELNWIFFSLVFIRRDEDPILIQTIKGAPIHRKWRFFIKGLKIWKETPKHIRF